MHNKQALTYDDVYLVPRYSDLETRADADTSILFGNKIFDLPVMPANMETVINDNWAKYFSENNYFYVMHRFNNVTVPFVRTANTLQCWRTISISTGVNEDSLKELEIISTEKLHVDFVTIDIAHGHHIKVKKRIKDIKRLLPNAFIIAGNITTKEAVKDLEAWGADAVKVGIGPGKACTTKLQTGFHIPMFTAVQNCAEVAKVPIIADGGIRYYGDIAKALTAGATMVMAGSLFASCTDSPAPIVNGRKVYYGSASFAAKKENKNVEGTLLELEQSISLQEKLAEIKQALQSSISYAGGTNLNCLNSTDYVTIK